MPSGAPSTPSSVSTTTSAAKCGAGRTAADIHAAGLRWIAEHGLDSEHGLHVLPFALFGHGIGVGFERPRLSAGDETILEPGMTVAVEMFVSEGGRLAAHEEVVLVTAGDPEILTAGCEARWWQA